MSLKNKIQIIERNKIIDTRGWFLKVINGKEQGLPTHTGEVYLISAHPGETRANHYHKEANEWFTLIHGKAKMRIEEIRTGETLTLELNADSPTTIFVPSFIAHSFENTGDVPYILIAYADRIYDPNDTKSYVLK